jgi:DnaK suppressor protein
MDRKDAILNLRQVLINRRDALRRALDDNMGLLGQVASKQSNEDPADGADGSAQQHIGSLLAEVENRELVCIDAALERMRKGEFGICQDCKISIPIARLNTLPYADRCIKCQCKVERQKVGIA